jgi:hypothetical protein
MSQLMRRAADDMRADGCAMSVLTGLRQRYALYGCD